MLFEVAAGCVCFQNSSLVPWQCLSSLTTISRTTMIDGPFASLLAACEAEVRRGGGLPEWRTSVL